MIASYFTGVAAVTIVVVVWVGVQSAWRRTFREGDGGDPDALAGRLGCHGCGCASPCAGAGASGEETEEVRR
jgi:hypothetical protein